MQEQPQVLQLRCASFRKTNLWIGFVDSHPSDENKYVARVGHPLFLLSRGRANARTTAGPSTSLRSGKLVSDLVSWSPTLATRNKNVAKMGHGAGVLLRALKTTARRCGGRRRRLVAG